MFKWTVLLSPVISGGPLSILRLLFSELSAITCFRCAFASVPVLYSSKASVKVECYTNHCLTIRSVSQTQYNLFLYKWQLPSKFLVKCSSHIRNSKSTPTLSECVSSSSGKTNNKLKQSAASRITHLRVLSVKSAESLLVGFGCEVEGFSARAFWVRSSAELSRFLIKISIRFRKWDWVK